MMCGAGLLNGARIFSFEQLLLDCEIYEIIRRTAAAIEISAETLALDTIDQVGSHNHFMSEPHTMAHLREIWQPTLIDRSPYEKWVFDGKKDILETAREKARHILENHRPEPLAPALEREMERLVEFYQQGNR
ncbi:MAG: trimethylamine methyltransferase family protein [Dethiobacter sp.]|jgi:trimethylamine--corrinoid protein Co-methyltransferase|nr:trimethylamine methyltransferase family protein [Dethiobacter sp.]